MHRDHDGHQIAPIPQQVALLHVPGIYCSATFGPIISNIKSTISTISSSNKTHWTPAEHCPNPAVLC